MSCPKAPELTAFLKGELEEAERLEMSRHVPVCPECSTESTRSGLLLERVRALPTASPSPGFSRRVRGAFVAAHPDFGPRLTWWETLKLRFSFVPAWSLSVAVHVALLAIATILFLAPNSEPEIREEEAYRAIPSRSPVREAPRRDHRMTPVRERQEEIRLWQERVKKDNAALGSLEARRDGHRKEELRVKYGVTGSADAIQSGLKWLSSRQEENGAWDAEKSGGDRDYSVGLTGLTLLAFLGDGHTHQSGAYRETVRRGLNHLIGEQAPSGLIGREESNSMYNHALASQALLEAYIMTRDEWLVAPVSHAVSYVVSAQGDNGGWGYTARASVSDTSIGGWMVFFLRMAFASGHQTAVPALHQARRRLDQMISPEDGTVAYSEESLYPNGPHALTAAGMLAVEMCSPLPDPELLDKQTKVLLGKKPIRTVDAMGYQQNDLCFGYFATLALFQRGGEAWTLWSRDLFASLLATQSPEGCWPRYFDKWAHYGGQVYSTSMATLILESTHRYPRLAE